jgi:hypothetical protein
LEKEVSNVIDMRTKKPLPPRVVSVEERTQALLLACMNDERAQLCSKDQPALRAFFEMNAQFLRSLAQ